MDFVKLWKLACNASFLSYITALVAECFGNKFIYHRTKAVVEYDRAYIYEFKSKNK
jgi:hypothetical protein